MALAASNGLALNDHFMIKFQFYDDYPIATDGYSIDDVRLWTGHYANHVYLPMLLKDN